MSTPSDSIEARQAIIDACLRMEACGINQGTSGNISLRVADGLLITPSAIPYTALLPEMICKIPLDGAPDLSGDHRPSTEWPFHQAAMRARPDAGALVHAHPVYATAVSCQRRTIPAVHYMVAAFGGSDVPVTGYALFGSDALSLMVAQALEHRHACLLANHGAITVADTLDRAMWRMQELENLAKIYAVSRATGSPVLLSEDDIQETLASFANYGLKQTS